MKNFLARFTIYFLLFTPFAVYSAPIDIDYRPHSNPSRKAYFQSEWQRGSPVSISGPLKILYADDFSNHRSERLYTVTDQSSGVDYQLKLDQDPSAQFRSGQVVTVQGRARGNKVFTLASQLDASGGSGSTVVASRGVLQSAAMPSGDQKTLVMVVNFLDKVVTTFGGGDCSNQGIQDRMFTDPLNQSVDDLYREMSWGKVSFSGTVVGRYTIAFNTTDPCDTNRWADAADALAAAAGVNLSAYPRKVYVMPNTSCPAAGLAQVGITPSRAWIFVCDLADSYAHELGHNLGWWHSSSPTGEYGDDTDVMGFGHGILRQVNAPHKVQMNWLPPADTPVISQNGSYSIAALEIDPAAAPAPQALKIYKSDTSEYYYISVRRPIGFDANISFMGTLDQVHVHRWNGANNTYYLTTLADGQSFDDPANGIHVTAISHDATLATVSVQFTSNAPVITSTPIASGAAGISFTYQITASQNPTSFNATGLPAGLSISTTTGLISGTVPAAGSWTIGLSASNTSGTGTMNLTLTMGPPFPDITSPWNAVGTVGNPFSYQITATNNPYGFNASPLPPNLVVSTATGLISGIPASTGTWTFWLTAYNVTGSASRQLTLSVTVGTATACDLNRNGVTDVSDVQVTVNQAIGASVCLPSTQSGSADINKDGRCNVIDVQRVVVAVLGGQCVSP